MTRARLAAHVSTDLKNLQIRLLIVMIKEGDEKGG